MFKPFGNPRKAEQVVEQILAAIREGRLSAGDRMPDENTMAAEFGVSRNCVREALRILETLETIEVRHGRGSFVRDTSPAEPPRIWLSWLRTFETEVLDLLEAREAVETKAAQLAAENAEPEDLAKLDDLADRMAAGAKSGELDVAALARLDRAFHAAVTVASRNTFLQKLAPGSWAASDRQATFLIEGRSLLSARQHQEIAAAIAARDPEAAGRAMSRHIRDVIEQVRAVNREPVNPGGTQRE